MQSLPKLCSWSCLLALAAYSGNALAYGQLDMTPGVTDISQQVFDLHRTMLYWCIAIGIVVFGAMFYSMFAHRKSKGAKAAQFHESTTVEIIWTIIPFVILILMAIPATRLMITMDNTDESDLTLKVTGSQWKWHYEYLEYDGSTDIDLHYFSTLSTPRDMYERPRFGWGLFPHSLAADRVGDTYPEFDDLYLLNVDNPLVVPTGKKIRLLLTSDDVIHAWWVPNFAIKKDAIPGFVNEMWFEVPHDQAGIYRGQCAELCGRDHAFMPIVVEAKAPAEFETWLADKQAALRAAEEAAAAGVDRTFTKEELLADGEQIYQARCSTCHQVSGQGMPPTFPALVNSPVATGPAADQIKLVLNGRNAMPGFANVLNPVELAAVITYTRNAWDNTPSDGVDIIQPRDVVNQ